MQFAATSGAAQLVQLDPSIDFNEAKLSIEKKLIANEINSNVKHGICCQVPSGGIGVVIASHAHAVCVPDPDCKN